MACVELLTRMALKRILYISQEIFPYVEQSEIAKVSRELPEYMKHSNEPTQPVHQQCFQGSN